MMLHELEETDEDDNGEKQDEGKGNRERARRGKLGRRRACTVSVKDGRRYYPFVVICIQGGHVFYTVTVALLQTASRTAFEGGVSEILAGRTLYCVSSSRQISVLCIKR
jgi:hypothetical protein